MCHLTATRIVVQAGPTSVPLSQVTVSPSWYKRKSPVVGRNGTDWSKGGPRQGVVVLGVKGKGQSQGRSRWFLRLGVVLAASVGFLAWSLMGRSEPLMIENRSGQTISFLEVTVGGEKSSYQYLATGATVTAPMKVKSTDSFAVEGRVEKALIKAHGVLGENRHLIVLPHGQLELKPPQRKLF